MECKKSYCRNTAHSMGFCLIHYAEDLETKNDQMIAEIKRREEQELGGARITIDHQIDPELQKEIGVSPVENDNIQLVVCRLASFCQTAHNKLADREAKLDALIETLEEMKTSYGQFVEMVEALKSKEGEK